jgi:hypothetical protein
MMWLELALLGAGRFADFFVRSDSDGCSGLDVAQWTSPALTRRNAAVVWITLARRRHGQGVVARRWRTSGKRGRRPGWKPDRDRRLASRKYTT